MDGLLERSEIEKNEGYGTGFFISDKKLIATNNHVVASKIGEDRDKEIVIGNVA